MSSGLQKLTKDFRRVAATALLLAVPFGLASCHREEAKDAHKTHRAAHHAVRKTTGDPPAAPEVNLNKPAASGSAGSAGEKDTLAPASSAELCAYGCPTGAPANDIVVTHGRFILSYNPDTKFSDWVAYEINAQTECGTGKRSWHRDKLLPPDVLQLSSSDYADISTLDLERGHQAPLAALSCDGAKDELDDLDNITPQSKDLNEGPWEELEKRESKLGGKVRSLTGTLYETAMPQLPRAKMPHTIPSGYWKLITVQQGDEFLTASFVFSQKAGREDDVCAAAVAIRVVEDRRHIEFFPQLDAHARKDLETQRGKLLPLLGCN